LIGGGRLFIRSLVPNALTSKVMNIQVDTAVRLQYQKLGRFPRRQHEAKANDFDFLKNFGRSILLRCTFWVS
jgi:hypothetical protein